MGGLASCRWCVQSRRGRGKQVCTRRCSPCASAASYLSLYRRRPALRARLGSRLPLHPEQARADGAHSLPAPAAARAASGDVAELPRCAHLCARRRRHPCHLDRGRLGGGGSRLLGIARLRADCEDGGIELSVYSRRTRVQRVGGPFRSSYASWSRRATPFSRGGLLGLVVAGLRLILVGPSPTASALSPEQRSRRWRSSAG